MNRFVNQIIRQVVRNGLNTGLRNAGRGGKEFSEMSTEERQQAKATQGQIQQGRRMLNIARRFMR